MDPLELDGKHVKIQWRDSNPKVGNKPEMTTLRGEVIQKDLGGLWVRGRFFVEKADTMSVREMPKEKESVDKQYFVPWHSVDVIEIVEEGSKEFEIHQLVRSRK